MPSSVYLLALAMENKISEFEHRSIETSQAEMQTKKTKKLNKIANMF